MQYIQRVKSGTVLSAELLNKLIDGHNASMVIGDNVHIQVQQTNNGNIIKYIGPPVVPSPTMFCTMTQTGGSQGTGIAANTYTYTVTNVITGEELATAFDPSASPSQWARANGPVDPATFGVGYRTVDGDLVLTWINETRRPDIGGLFHVTMTQTGGSQGTSTAAATYTYTIEDTAAETELETSFNPVTTPSEWRRSFGQITPATAGIAYYNVTDDLIITWCNEFYTGEECP